MEQMLFLIKFQVSNNVNILVSVKFKIKAIIIAIIFNKYFVF